jgi:hypothetical protein
LVDSFPSHFTAARATSFAELAERRFLLGILNAYEANGETELGTRKLSDFLTARYETLADAKETLGDTGAIRQAFVNVQRDLYRQ